MSFAKSPSGSSGAIDARQVWFLGGGLAVGGGEGVRGGGAWKDGWLNVALASTGPLPAQLHRSIGTLNTYGITG